MSAPTVSVSHNIIGVITQSSTLDFEHNDSLLNPSMTTHSITSIEQNSSHDTQIVSSTMSSNKNSIFYIPLDIILHPEFSFTIHALLDTGSTSTLIKYETFNKINKVTPLKLNKPQVKLKSITANELTVHGTVKLNIRFKDAIFQINIFVVDDNFSFKGQMLIGQDFFFKYRYYFKFQK